jgi:ABC-type phosphate transport system substrate-binding protein
MYQFGATRPVIIVILDSSKGKKYMDIAARKRFILGPLVALLLGLSAVCCMVFADTSSAAAPGGTSLDCQSSEGKISGRGSTYQNVLLKEYAKVYGEEFCGNVAEQYSGDPAGSNMVAYNYPKAVSASLTGSGNGIKAANCRTDAFAGSDTPYSEKQLTELDGAPGAAGIGGCSLPSGFEPPFTPNTAPFPNTNDITAPVMALPVGGSAVTVAVHLGTTSCTGTAPTSLHFTPKEVSRLYGGDITAWNDPELVVNNASLKEDGCTGPVTRVVREDSSGTTNILKQYLIRVDNERTGSACGVISSVIQKWEAYFTTNTEWPGKQKVGEEGTCSPITTGALSGGGELLAKLKTVEGGVGYIDLAEAVEQPGIVLASVDNATGTKFEAPSIGGGAANCLYTALPAPPGSSNAAAVGLDLEDNWSNNNETNPGSPANHENATDLGSKYPICGLTFDLVYTGLNSNNGEGKSAISRLTADQRRTMYSFFTFILSSAGQEVPAKIHYAPLPASWLPKLAQGFQENF